MEAAELATAPIAEANSRKWLVAFAVMLGPILEMLDTSITNVALPHMQGSFSASIDEITWVATSYLVANGIMIPLTGWISARFGRKRYFLLSVVTFLFSSVCCGAAQTLGQMVFFRLIQGFAGAAMLPSSMAILMELFPPEEQQMAMAFWGMGILMAPAAGPTIGGWITDNWSWRWNFYINVPIGIVAFLMVSSLLEDPPYLKRRTGSKIDYVAIILLVLGMGLAQIVADRGQRADWFASAWVVYATAGSALAILLLTIREWRTPEPIVDVRMFAIPAFTLSVLPSVMISFTNFGTALLNPIFLQEFMGYTAWRAGLALSPRAIGSAVAMLVVGQMARRGINTRSLIPAGFVVMGLALWQMSCWNLQITLWQIIPSVFFQGLGAGIASAQLAAIPLAAAGRERAGYAASLFNMIRNTGAAIGISTLTSLFLSHQQIHQSFLGEHFTIFEAWKMAKQAQRMPGSPKFLLPQLPGGNKHGLLMVYNLIQHQASALAFNDMYRIMYALCVVMIPFYLFLRNAPMAMRGDSH